MSKCEHCIARQLNSMNALSKVELKRVSECKTTRLYKKGDIIFSENELLHGVYCVRDGICKLIKSNENGKDQTVKLLGKGELIGQRSIISDERTNMSAIALNDIELCYVPKDEIINNLKGNPNFSFDVLQNLAQDLKTAEVNLIKKAQNTVKQRLADTIIYIHNNFGTTKEGHLKVVISREDYANLVGTATESVIRILSQLKKEGLIATKGKQIRILDMDGLMQIK